MKAHDEIQAIAEEVRDTLAGLPSDTERGCLVTPAQLDRLTALTQEMREKAAAQLAQTRLNAYGKRRLPS